MIKRRLGFAGILLAGLILVLYLTGGGKIFGRLGVSRCEKLWKESEEVMVEGEVYQKTRKEEKLILYLKKIQIREMGNGKAVADERLLVYLDEKGNGPEIGTAGSWLKAMWDFLIQRPIRAILTRKIIISSRISRQSYGKGRFWKTGEKDSLPGKAVAV